uniref:Uncharacterized protein n=1 Tax=Geospiza parvula TaxID=87175 RepID=A0A8C3NE17_GEOPR
MSAVVFLLGNLIGTAVGRGLGPGRGGGGGRGGGRLRAHPALCPAGKYSAELSPSFLLNLPYLLLLTWAGLRLFQQPRALPNLSPEQVRPEPGPGGGLGAAAVVLDCPADSCFDYTYLHEPYLRDPVGYPKVQMLIYLFYLLPFLLLAIYGLAWPGCSWLPDWSLLFAGAVAQAQFAHLGSSLHSRTPFPYQTPEEVLGTFLLSNVLYALGPQLLALRCLRSPAFFVRSEPVCP